MFKKIINRAHWNERGITGLETAIILIAFVVVASVFAYTVLSAGLFSARHADETVRSGIRTTQTTMSLRGGIVAYADNITAAGEAVTRISFTVSNVLPEGHPIDLTPPYTLDAAGNDLIANADARSVATISFVSARIVIPEAAWTVKFTGGYEGDDDFLLEDVEKATITVWLVNFTGGTYSLGTADDPFIADAGELLKTNAIFYIQMMPPQGATLLIPERTPADLRPIMRL